VSDRGGQRVRRVLVVAEVALALTLLTGAGLLVRSFAALQGVDPGFRPDNVLTFNVALPASKYPSDTARRAFLDALLPRLAAVPGVRNVATTTNMPFGGNWSTGSFNVEGYTPPPNAQGPWGDIRMVSPGFFETLNIPLVRGRTLGSQDVNPDGPYAAVVDDEFARRFYAEGVDPIGKRIWFGNPTPTDSTEYITIVGVVGHTAHEGLDAEKRVQFYMTYHQGGRTGSVDVAVRTRGEPLSSVNAVRAALQSLDRDVPMSRIRTLDALVAESMGQRRLSMVLLGVFAGLALLLASLGIYGVMSYSVAQRSRDLGVRMALGAARGSVLALVMRQGIVLAAAGIGVGLVGAFALTRLISSQLYSVRPTDPATFAGVALLLGGIAVLATFIPALRATRVDPVVALREE
jgi:predicted permease